MPLDRNKKIFIAGHQGLVGSALCERFTSAGFQNIITRTKDELNLEDEVAVKHFFSTEEPNYVIVAAAKVGGILANSTYPADFLLCNLRIQNAVIANAFEFGVDKLLFLGSSCIYPKFAPQPIPESALLTGPLEPTNEWYAIAKIAGIKLCQALRMQHKFDAICAMPTNLYGPRDNFHPRNSHVLPALIRRFVEAKEQNLPEVVCWGTGNVQREFLHVTDLADGCLHLLDNYSGPEIVNLGTGEDTFIYDLVDIVKKAVGYEGSVSWDPSKPDGTPRKVMDVSRMSKELGWKASISIEEGVKSTVRWYLENRNITRQ
jgi:GDP-L-fucose synthase